MKTKKTIKSESGFTLVELMMVLVCASIVFYGITSVVISGSSQAEALGVKTTMQESAQQGLHKMIEEIRESAPSKIVTGTNSITFNIPSAVDSNGNVSWGGDITYSLGGLNNQQIVRMMNGSSSTAQVIANDVQAVVFNLNDPADPTLVTIDLTLQRETLKGRTYLENLTGQAKVRNG